MLRRSCTGGKTEDFQAAAQLLHRAGARVAVPTYLVPATQKVWADLYGLPVPGCEGRTAAQIFEAAGEAGTWPVGQVVSCCSTTAAS